MPYTNPIIFTGDHLARTPSQPVNQGNPGDANFAMIVRDAAAVGTENDIYRLVWTGNVNNPGQTDSFKNGQWWSIQKYDPAQDDDHNPTTGEGGWASAPVYQQLNPKPDLVAGLGSGDNYIVFENQGPGGGHLIFDVDKVFPKTPENVTYPGPDTGDLHFDDAGKTYPPCFTRGTMIDTPQGRVAVENLLPGDLVLTRDHGAQPLRWIGSRKLSGALLTLFGDMRPIRIRAGALGRKVPAADLVVSPQHRVLVRSRIAERMFGESEVLVAAKQLLVVDGVDIVQDMAEVEYFHLLFDSHEIVMSNGAETESLFTGPQALKALGAAARREILTLFPELAAPDHETVGARMLVSGRQGRKLAMRHRNNQRVLQHA